MRIQSNENEVSYVDFRMNDAPLRTVIRYSDGGNKIEGVTVDETGFSGGAPDYDWFDMQLVTAFSLDRAQQQFAAQKPFQRRSWISITWTLRDFQQLHLLRYLMSHQV